MAEFTYNNAKNASIGHKFFELNYKYYPCVSNKEDLDPRSKSRTAKKLFFKLQNLMTVYQRNLYHTQKLQKQAHNRGIKLQIYALGDKIWLNSIYLKTKRNYNFEAKFLYLFWVLDPIGKQVFKLKLPKK